jgi:hypothetical protein
MRNSTPIVAFLLFALPLAGLARQDDEDRPKKKDLPPITARFGIDFSPILYPQASPKEAMASVIKAIDDERLDYLMAQLANPRFVDSQVAAYAGQAAARDKSRRFFAFEKLVRETKDYYSGDPKLVRQLRVFARAADWDVADDVATGTVKDLPALKMVLRQIDGRWFLDNLRE